MSAVLFRCPKTEKSVDIGLETDADSLAAMQSQTVDIVCSFCGEHHTFQMKDARLRDYRLAKKHFVAPIGGGHKNDR
jgi:hypothetical protein